MKDPDPRPGVPDQPGGANARRSWSGIWFLLASVIVAILISELLIRTLFPQELTPLGGWASCCGDFFEPDPQYGWMARPGYRGEYVHDTQVAINSLGLRDHEYGPKRNDEIRILSLGDSFAFGFGVELEEDYAKMLENMLRKRFPTVEISVINGGLAAYNSHHVIMEFDRLQPLLDPDFVIAAFVAGNDVADNPVFDEQLEQWLQSPVGFLGRHSHLFRLILRSTFAPRYFAANRSKKNIEYTNGLLDDLDADVHRANLPLAILIIPARHQVRPSVNPGTALLDRLGAQGYILRQNNMVREHLETTGVPYVDTYPALAERDSIDAVFFDDDPHTNALGYRIIAEATYEAILPTIEKLVEERTAVSP